MLRLRKNKEFTYVYRKGEKVSTKHLTLFYVKSKFENFKIGFSISKKLGKAHIRNKLKRRLREICRREVKILPYHNYVLLVRDGAQELSYEKLRDEVKEIFEKYEKKKSL